MSPHIYKLIAKFAIGKGIVIGAATSSLNVEFWKSVIIAVISGGIGATGAIVAALIATREARQNREKLQDIQRSIGVSRRAGDDGVAGRKDA